MVGIPFINTKNYDTSFIVCFTKDNVMDVDVFECDTEKEALNLFRKKYGNADIDYVSEARSSLMGVQSDIIRELNV